MILQMRIVPPKWRRCFLVAAAEPSINAGAVASLASLLGAAELPLAMRNALARDVEAGGAMHVQELVREDWDALSSWQSLRPLERRRVLKCM